MTEPAALDRRAAMSVAPGDQAPAVPPRPTLQVTAPPLVELSEGAANDPEFAIDPDDPRHSQTRLFLQMELPDVFNERAAPPGVEHTFAQLAMARQLENSYGELTIGVQGGGAIYTEENDIYDYENDEDEPEENGKKRGAKLGPSMKKISEEIRRMEEHARAWDAELHSIGGRQMSGAELKERMDYILDERNHQKIEQDLVTNEGLTPDQARQRREQMVEMAKLLEKERNGQISAEERRRLQALKDGPTGQSMSQLQAITKEQGIRIEKNAGSYGSEPAKVEEGVSAFSLATSRNESRQDQEFERILEIARIARSGGPDVGNQHGIMIASSKDGSAPARISAEPAAISGPVELTDTYNQASTATSSAPVLAAAPDIVIAKANVSSGNRVI